MLRNTKRNGKTRFPRARQFDRVGRQTGRDEERGKQALEQLRAQLGTARWALGLRRKRRREVDATTVKENQMGGEDTHGADGSDKLAFGMDR